MPYKSELIKIKSNTMNRFTRTEKGSRTIVNVAWWRLLLVILTMEIVFVKHGRPQVDTSKALIWSATDLQDRSTLVILYGDPGDITNPSYQGNITSYSTTVLTFQDSSGRIGVLDTGYQQSIVYFYFTQNIYFSTQFIQYSTGEYESSYLNIPAVSIQVTGFAFDWVSSLLYWSDAAYKRICLIDTSTYLFWRALVDTNITSPQDVVVYPQQSYLFWSDLGDDPKIERLDLTNDQRKVLISNGSLQRPTTLAIDAATQRLFWLDSVKETIGSMTFDGSNVSLWSLPLFSTISSFVLYKNYIIFGDKAQSAVYFYNVTQRQYLANITTLHRGIIDMTMWSPERQPPVSSPCTSLKGGCDHFCITVSATSRRCTCAMGFFLAPDGSSCVTKPFETDRFLLVTDERQTTIFQIDVETGEVRALTSSDGVFPTAVGFDPIGKCLYWFDSTNKRIKRTAFGNSYTETFLGQFGNEITSLAVDTVSRNLYYADHGTGTIGQISLSTASNKTLLETAGSQPRALVLDINMRLIYWSDCGSLTIERGLIANPAINRVAIATGLANCVTAFAIDFQGQVIYWGYDFGRIEKAKLDGTLRTTIHEESLAPCYGLALDSRYLYIAYSNKRQIQKLDRNTNQVTNLTKILFTQPYALLYYAYDSQSTIATLTTTSSISETATAWNSYFTTIEFGSTTPPGGPSLTVILPAAICSSVAFIAGTVTLGVIFGLRYKKKRAGNTGRTMKPDETEMSDNHGYQALCAAGLASTEQRVLPASGLAGNAYSSSSPSYMYDNNRSQTMSRSDKCISLYPDTYDVLVDPDLAKPPLPPPRPSEINPGDSDDYLNASDLHPSSKDHTDIYSTYIE